ncbi:DUF4145 domain-containing protein [Cupriavidus gilardii]|uniref:DUF4145 domain-containing protein n=1 Tax=Cupriavidus gilardii TaxID=82541 RepID=UPI0021B23368|nr:DUF4145 domain-containing protein [Cupriavidus gilardii]UXC35152.1 DUF4145 domain-containing protein [Cupriavidus gilardii]
MNSEFKSTAEHFGIERCPQCGIAAPNMVIVHRAKVHDEWDRFYGLLTCQSCRHSTMVYAGPMHGTLGVWPAPKSYSNDIPTRVRGKLVEAQGTLGFPSPSILCSAAAIDWMLKEKGYTEGKLFRRIEQAASDHVITDDMKEWAHEVRLGANAERHADMDEPEPTKEDAERLLKFAEALAEILFELPARVKRGRGKPEEQNNAQDK